MSWSNLDLDKIKGAFEPISGKITFGIDGYVDEVWEVVEARANKQEFTKYTQMKKFGELIVNCGTGGLSTEIVRKRRSFGGFTANTGKAASNLGIDTTMIGLYGERDIDSVFKEFEQTCHLYSIGNPAICHIMEFEDGKLMLVYIQEIMEIGWETLAQPLPEEALNQVFSEADIIALGYWSNIPAFDDFVEGITKNYLNDDSSQRIFLDLADIRKRDDASLHKTMDALSDLNRKHPITLSLNEHEAALLFASYHMGFQDNFDLVQECMENLQKILSLDEITVHTPQFAAAATAKGESAVVIQRYCEKPVRTAAAGDNFNGGYLSACIASLSLWERLAVANAATSIFLRQGRSANRVELLNELEDMIHHFNK